jgi:hypothetical protein
MGRNTTFDAGGVPVFATVIFAVPADAIFAERTVTVQVARVGGAAIGFAAVQVVESGSATPFQ